MWRKLTDKKPKDGQKILVLLWGTDIFPATALYSKSGELVLFPEVDCIDCEAENGMRPAVNNPKFIGAASYWMPMPKLPKGE